MKTTMPPALPSFAGEDDNAEPTALKKLSATGSARRPFLLQLVGPAAGTSTAVVGSAVTIGRAPSCTIHVPLESVSRIHAQVVDREGRYVIEDVGSSNGTLVNGARLVGPHRLVDGDKIQIGEVVLKYALYDELDEDYERRLRSPEQAPISVSTRRWSPDSWRTKEVAQDIQYPDRQALERTVEKLRSYPPLVTSWEIEDLKRQLADAQAGRRFVLQGGDCAEALADCKPGIITNKLKILIQMSLVLIRGARRPVVRVGRFAGQYAKPRSKPTERRGDVELPSYFGDLVNRAEFTADARQPDPELLIEGYQHAAMTLNFIRALSGGGFADLRRPEYFDLSFFERAELPTDVRTDYARLCRDVTEGLHFMQAVNDRANSDLMKVSFFTSHEGLNLHYEEAQTRQVPRRDGYYDLTTHMPWIGERTRQLSGAHIEFFRGIQNPVAIKLGPTATVEDAVNLCQTLNPRNEPGKIVLVARMGAAKVGAALGPLVTGVTKSRQRVLWMCDPMHGNAITTRDGIKTRDFEDILREIEISMDVHEACGTYLGGVHFELTGEDVTECIGGGLREDELSRNYSTNCDPRLNYRQAIQMAFCLARRLNDAPRAPSSMPPPSFR